MNKPLDAIHPSEILPFDMYFSTIVGMNMHPGNTREPIQRKSLENCAARAIVMLTIRRQLIPLEESSLEQVNE